jgi:hypothetical protein
MKKLNRELDYNEREIKNFAIIAIIKFYDFLVNLQAKYRKYHLKTIC